MPSQAKTYPKPYFKKPIYVIKQILIYHLEYFVAQIVDHAKK